MTEKKSKLATVIVITGLLAGTLDILAAVIRYTIRTGNSPVRLLEFIASAVFGREEAFSGNAMMGIWGLFFHYLIAFTWTIVFFLAYPTDVDTVLKNATIFYRHFSTFASPRSSM